VIFAQIAIRKETKFTQRLRKALARLGWEKHEFEIAKVVDGVQRESTSHEVDHVKRLEGIGVIACEIEWNNKDPLLIGLPASSKIRGNIDLGIVFFGHGGLRCLFSQRFEAKLP